MSLLRTIERRLSSLVEGAFGKAFRSHVQPVELARRLVKEMDDHQSVAVRKIYVPNRYDIYLAPDDHAQFSGYESALRNELAEYLTEHARRNGYSVLTRPRVDLRIDQDLTVGVFGILASMDDSEVGGDVNVEIPPVAGAAAAGATMVFTAEQVQQASDALQYIVVAPTESVQLNRETVTMGRGRANTLVLNDASVSREHACIELRGVDWYVRDLDSTNGVTVNGNRVTDRCLAAGDVMRLGNVELRFERTHAGAHQT